jgi:predicted dehydrogenase
MSQPLDRRAFLQASAAAGAVYGVHSAAAAEETKSAADKVAVAVMGVNGRGAALAGGFAVQPGAEVAYVCDADERAVAKAVAQVASRQARKPEGVRDFRNALDDKSVDALVIAAPDHWHGPATILGCAAGKHVYVEKPCSHNPREGELMIAAARKNNVVVTIGTQRRSSAGVREAIEKVRGGAIGRTLYARSWYNNRRGSIGKGMPAEVPTWLDYTLWQGPAPERPFRDNYIHYNWHWFWHWGTGELGNNGVHSIDVCRWGLGVDYPTRVSSGGSKLRWDDDQETPDTHSVSFEFEGKSIFWQGLSWSPRGMEGNAFGMSFHGDNGTLLVSDNSYKIYDMQNKEVGGGGGGGGGDAPHLADFLDAIRTGRRPNADIEEGHKSTLLCHLGNIAHRAGRTLECDPANGRIRNDPGAEALWQREYRPGWEPVV